MSPRGGKREAGPGKRLGRPRIHTEGSKAPRRAVTISASLDPEEAAQLDLLLEELKITRSDFIRRCLANAWIFRLAPAQLDALHSLIGPADRGDEEAK